MKAIRMRSCASFTPLQDARLERAQPWVETLPQPILSTPQLVQHRPEGTHTLAGERRIPRLRVLFRHRALFDRRGAGGLGKNRAQYPKRPDRLHRRGCWGRAPKAPPPWPGTGLFHGSWLEVEAGPTGLGSSSSSSVAQEGRTAARTTAARIMRMPQHKKASAACKLGRRRNQTTQISWSPGWQGSRGRRAGCGHPEPPFRDRSRRWFGKARSRTA